MFPAERQSGPPPRSACSSCSSWRLHPTQHGLQEVWVKQMSTAAEDGLAYPAVSQVSHVHHVVHPQQTRRSGAVLPGRLPVPGTDTPRVRREI